MIVVFVSAFLQGCLGKKNEINEDVVFLQSVPVCSSDEMCKKMWDAAGAWVDKYSTQGIETYSDSLIQSEEKEVGSDGMDITIKKIKQKDGAYKIIIDNACSRSLGSCSIERSNMIAFNKKLISFMSVKEKAVKKEVFNTNADFKQWLTKYEVAINKFDSDLLAGSFHLPVTYIEKDEIIVLKTKQDVSAYLKNIEVKFTAVKGEYIKADSIDIFARTGRNLYVNVVFNLYDAESAVVAAQQVGLHLIRVNKQWKMLSSGLHTQ